MKLVLTMMVRDEVDIIAPMVEHHLDQGIDLIIATDNASADGTTEVLKAYAEAGVVELHHDPVHRKQQHSVVTAMARRARTEHAADWVLNADADEFWTAADRSLTVREALQKIPLSLNAFTVPVVNLVGPPAMRGAGFDRLVWRDHRSPEHLRSVGIHAQPTPNAVHRGHPDIVVAQGNHFVSLESNGQPDDAFQLEVLHLPWRSWTQFERKVVQAGLAYEASENLRPSKNHHGRADYGRYKSERLFEAFMLRQPVAADIATAESEGWLRSDGWLLEHLHQLVDRALRPDLLRTALESSDDEPFDVATHRAAVELGRKFIDLELERDDARRLADDKARVAQRLARQRDSARVEAKKAAEELALLTRQRDIARTRLQGTRVELARLKRQPGATPSSQKPPGVRTKMRRTAKRVRRRMRRVLRMARPGRTSSGGGATKPAGVKAAPHRAPAAARAARPKSAPATARPGTAPATAPKSRPAPVAVPSPQAGPGPQQNVQVLAMSPLFDAAWYSQQRGKEVPKRVAAQDYLKRGRALGWTPHPLFDSEYFALNRADEIGDEDPFVAYLTTPAYTCEPTHPLFDVAGYLASFPTAADHPGGPLAHYAEIGAPGGAHPNDWYEPDIDAQPDGLLGWIRERHAEWAQRHAAVVPKFTPSRPEVSRDSAAPSPEPAPARVGTGTPLVTVVVAVQQIRERMPAILDSIVAQTLTDWQLVVVTDAEADAETAAALQTLQQDPRVDTVQHTRRTIPQAYNAGLAAAKGSYVAWMDGEALWHPGHLEQAVTRLQAQDERVGYAVIERAAGPPGSGFKSFSAGDVTRAQLEAASLINLNVLLVERRLAVDIGGFDESVPGSVHYNFVLKLSATEPLLYIPFVGAELIGGRPRSRPASMAPEVWDNAALNNHLVNWDGVTEPDTSEVAVTVIIPTPNDYRLTAAAVQSIARAAASSDVPVETIVVDNGSLPSAAAVLDSLPLRFPEVRVVHSPVNRGFALGNNLAMASARGNIIVFLNNDTEVTQGWLEPLVESLAVPEVLGAQSLLLYPSGSIQSAGIAFPSCGGLPHMLLRGYPVEDAAGIQDATFTAVTAAALAVRRSDVVALRGFDPLFLNGMEDVDFGLRLRAAREGRFVVRPDSVVTHHESRSPGRYANSVPNRKLLLDRWKGRMPGDDIRLWAGQGFDVVGYNITSRVSDDRRLEVPHPVVTRKGRLSVLERPPRMRWAIKVPAPADEAEKWGDTHFARRIAEALRAEGQEVIIDYRAEWDRASARHDDVVLALRGVARYQPVYGPVSMMWVISHPSWLKAPELASYDRVFAASSTWADQASRQFGVRVETLLQATDPARFHPDLAEPDSGYPCLFVGGSRRILRPIVRQAISVGMPLSVFGTEWEGLIPDSYVVGKHLPNERLGAAYRAAGIVLNDHWDDMREDGFLSNRLFDAVASGARIVSDDVRGLEEIFGSSVQVVRDDEDLRRIFTAPDPDLVFGDDEERRRNAKRIHAEHSFDVRARQLLAAAAAAYADQSDARREMLRAP